MEKPNLRVELRNLRNQANKIVDYCRKIEFKNINFKNINMKIALTKLMIISIIALSIMGYKINQIRMKAFDVYLGNDKIGTVRQQEEITEILNVLETELANTYEIDVVLDKGIRFEEVKAKDDVITSNQELKKEIKAKMSFLVYGYVLKVNDVEIGALKTKEEIEKVINRIKEPYENGVKEGTNIKEIKIIEKVEIVKKEMPLYKIGNSEELYNHLLTGSEDIKTHIVEVGESFWTIAKIYNLSVDDLINANPDKKPEKIQIGDEVKLVVSKPILTVSTMSEVEYTEKIKYETEIEYNDKMYKNEKKTKVAGVDGERKIVANEVKHNGVVIEKEILKEDIVQNPVNEVIVKGTKEVPRTVATGAFAMPTRGSISSRYGMRNGRMHRGLDIAAKTGTAIKAADGGKVVYVGYRGAFGNLVEIDHGNGFRTRYAHCSKILVKRGDKVYKGQHIANVGNTGRSTGSHLHFEVLKNGKNYNPSNYLK
ncbi:Murein DD-endopeptidase MepM and murein hydrolase activator NlpD, contain LysM domain [Tissierella praeacuta DSM 18095]|uniref:Murein DD-endopeptidase MepM and murein hydrolase activator NlpD, contain LysM domain n=1 Tax=Tissierella praeacuta DSM 18095 TaxID=1123404 RepID=A0A1M4YYE1_9FIRM|nr:M23 family metallopeptidase [Tissierella praeacuta]TCU66228.1 murein DD-endopeptidase MepM/ murein hydrolase activator NlpD [Tissierella praeacuta]SHF10849.1 Murein DD-endopeptidase MepM and murein hydrolase activator NlpD, contain LysM domain [Tissierella praeacuta DSM 18095]SUP04914.1 Murein hydrolase activator NlpD precursor [Tissierella praeacuta]